MKPDYAQSVALKVLHALKAAGIDALCVGGCPRDIYHGKDVADIDVVVRGDTDTDLLYSALSATMDEISGDATDWDCELFSEYGEDDDLLGEHDGDELDVTNDFRERIEYVYKFKVSTDTETFGIDILASQNCDQNEPLEKFLDTFDFTINQWSLNHEGYVIGSQHTGLRVKPIDGLSRCKRTTDRYKRLSAKYPDHDWSAVEAFISGGSNCTPQL